MTESLYNIVVEKHAVSNKVRLFKHSILFIELGNPLPASSSVYATEVKWSPKYFV